MRIMLNGQLNAFCLVGGYRCLKKTQPSKDKIFAVRITVSITPLQDKDRFFLRNPRILQGLFLP